MVTVPVRSSACFRFIWGPRVGEGRSGTGMGEGSDDSSIQTGDLGFHTPSSVSTFEESSMLEFIYQGWERKCRMVNI